METEEQIIVLENDDVPSMCFFTFCDEMLERYRNEKQVFMICGRNQLGETHYDQNSYFFSRSASIWGGATWRDRWQRVDFKHNFLLDREKVKKVRKAFPTYYSGMRFIDTCTRHRNISLRDNKVASYESPIAATIYLNDFLSIVPAKNLIQNVGITGDSEHTASGINNITKGQRQIYLIKAMELDYPLHHPSEINANKVFQKARLKLLGSDYWCRHQYRRISGFILRKLRK